MANNEDIDPRGQSDIDENKTVAVENHSLQVKDDPLIRFLHKVISLAVRFLAVMMVAVICWGVVDVGYVLYQKLLSPPVGVLEMHEILATFGAFMAVLIAIEIFHNIVLYLRSDLIHIKIVLATALMAIARKVIVMDFNEISPLYVFATAAVVLALGFVYWLVVARGTTKSLLRDE